MNDSIFIILSTMYGENYGLYSIYEYVENNGLMKWSYIGNFGDREYYFIMPPVIQSIESGKLFFFPLATIVSGAYLEINMKFVNPIELWMKNKTLTRSLFAFSKDLRPNEETFALLILQI